MNEFILNNLEEVTQEKPFNFHVSLMHNRFTSSRTHRTFSYEISDKKFTIIFRRKKLIGYIREATLLISYRTHLIDDFGNEFSNIKTVVRFGVFNMKTYEFMIDDNDESYFTQQTIHF